jgi:hypothetical protein
MFNFLLPQTVLCFAGLWLPLATKVCENAGNIAGYLPRDRRSGYPPHKSANIFRDEGFVSPANIWSNGVNMFFKKMHYDVFLRGTIAAADSQHKIYLSKTAASPIDLTVEPISNAIADLADRVAFIERWINFYMSLEDQPEESDLDRKPAAKPKPVAGSPDVGFVLKKSVEAAAAAMKRIADSRTAKRSVYTRGDAKPAFAEAKDSPAAKDKGGSGETTATQNDAGGVEIVAEAAESKSQV